MNFRYRRLKASRDAQAVAELRAEFSESSTAPGDDLDAAVRAERSAPLKVDAVEAEASLEELEELLRARKLTPGDLVFSNGAWTTFADAPEFFELCSDLGDVRTKHRGLMGALDLLFRGLFAAISTLLNAVFRYR